MKTPKILVVGSLVMDLIYSTSKVPNEGETVNDGLAFSSAPGGKGANQAVQAARLGIDVTMVGKLGKDMFGDELLKAIKDAGINTDYILRDEASSSAVSNIILEVAKNKKTKNRIIVVPGTNMKLTVEDVAFLKDKISEYDMVILQLEIPLEVNKRVIEYAYAKGVPVMLNSAPYQALEDDILSRLSYISPNEHEAYGLTGIKTTKEDGSIDIKKVETAAKALLDKGVKNVIITLGSNGVAFMNKDIFVVKPCVDIVDVIDPTAAGDSFTGSFCSAVCMGMQPDKALDFANYTATLTVSRMGAITSLPTIKEVRDLMEKDNYYEMNGGAKMEKSLDEILQDFVNISLNEMKELKNKINLKFYEAAINLIIDAEKNGNRVHITGIGKPGHVAGYIASLLSSTGTPTYELNGTEAVHGSSGQVRQGDVVIAISNSGETSELKATVTALKNNGAKIIAVTGGEESWLAQNSDVFLYAGVNKEGDPLNRAPRASILAEVYVLQGLSLLLQCEKNITPQQYVKWHPGGTLGQLRESEIR